MEVRIEPGSMSAQIGWVKQMQKRYFKSDSLRRCTESKESIQNLQEFDWKSALEYGERRSYLDRYQVSGLSSFQDLHAYPAF